MSGTASVFQPLNKPPLEWILEKCKDHIAVIVDNHN
jgi:hypothetical protein